MAKEKQKPHPVVLNKLKPGDIMLEDNVLRLVKVIGPAVVVIPHRPTIDNGMRGRIEEVPAVRVHCTIPTVEIDGLFTKKRAGQGMNVLRGCKGEGDDDEYDNRIWQEIWATRMVGVKVEKEGADCISDTMFRPQVYCHQIEDMAGEVLVGPGVDPSPQAMTLRSSGIMGLEVLVTDIPKRLMHGDPWAIAGQPAEAPEKVSA